MIISQGKQIKLPVITGRGAGGKTVFQKVREDESSHYKQVREQTGDAEFSRHWCWLAGKHSRVASLFRAHGFSTLALRLVSVPGKQAGGFRQSSF